MMVGEIRDPETAHIACRAGLTGVTVLSTLHANDTASTVDVFREFGVPPMFIADSLVGIISQRLVRKACPKCRQTVHPDAAAPPARATVKAGLTSPDYLIEIAMVAVKDASRTPFTTPNADGTPGTPNANLSSAIRVGNRLYVAGITGNTATNKGDVRAQTAEVLGRVGRTLKAAGFEWSSVVDGVVYLPDMTKFQDMNATYRGTFSKDFPARATVGTGLMGADAAVEIMFTAVK